MGYCHKEEILFNQLASLNVTVLLKVIYSIGGKRTIEM